MPLSFTPVIGLEIHVQLATVSKLFCSCSTDYIGQKPNTNICPVCLGLPGTLPVLNGRAVEFATKTALALNCRVQNRTRFHRKNYFYPDLPKAYQISQYDLPLAVGGYVELTEADGSKRRIGIQRLHLEEDTGKLVHIASDGRLSGALYSLVDYNRAGIPLMEIVSAPDITSPAQAKEYVARLRQLVRYLGVSDGDMESGSLRVDANISVKVSDGRWGKKSEIKNMNSLRAIERALEYEIERQSGMLARGEEVEQETRHWDDAAGVTRSSRSKEEAHDYRYFPEPDLLPLVLEEGFLEEIAESMPELPWEVFKRFEEVYGIEPEDAALLSERRDVAAYFEACVKAGASPDKAANWIKTELFRVMNERKCSADDFPVRPEVLTELLRKVEQGDLSATAAKDVFGLMAGQGLKLDEAIKAAGVSVGKVSGGALKDIIDEVLRENAEVIEDIKSGRDKKGKKVKFLQGLVMRRTKGQADPQEVSELLDESLKN